MAASKDHIFYSSEHSQKFEKMINNQKYSDIIFLVNNSNIHASKHVVSGASEYFESLILCSSNGSSNHSINIANIKNSESFMVILRYLYGVGINFSKMNASVMHEVLHLCGLYKLPVFAKELQTHLSNLNNFSLDSAVALLNYSEKSNVKVLYDKLIIYAYTQAEKLVKHESFVDLNYKVLVALLKSDSFCAQEIDILTAILKWHEKSGTNGLVVSGNPGKAPTQMSSHEVLKSLLCHVRISRIVVLDLVNAFKTELFSKYKDVLAENKLGDLQALVSLESKTRSKYIEPAAISPVTPENLEIIPYEFNSKVLRKFEFHVKDACSHEKYSSSSGQIACDLTWSVRVSHHYNTTNCDYTISIDLLCSSDKLSSLEVYVDYQTTIKSFSSDLKKYPSSVSPGKEQYLTVKLQPGMLANIKQLKYDKYSSDYPEWVSAYVRNGFLQIEVLLRCIHIKGTKKK